MSRTAQPGGERDDGLITRARTLAHHLEKDAGRPGAASVINDLVAEIERLRKTSGET